MTASEGNGAPASQPLEDFRSEVTCRVQGKAGQWAHRATNNGNQQANQRQPPCARATVVPDRAGRAAHRRNPSAGPHQGRDRCCRRSCEYRAGDTKPIGSSAGGFVQSGFNEVAHRASHHSRSRATSQNPPDSQIAFEVIQTVYRTGGRQACRRLFRLIFVFGCLRRSRRADTSPGRRTLSWRAWHRFRS